MNNKISCEIIKDLLPLYADEICSEQSCQLVEKHIAECKSCSQELEDYRYNTGIPAINEKEAVKSFSKKLRKKTVKKVVLSVIVCLCVVFGCAYALFVPEYVVPYSEDLLRANIPVDKGIDVWVNLDNYCYVQTWDLRDDDGMTDIYLTVMQNNFTKIFDDSDKSDHLWRIGNSNECAICFQGERPNYISGEEPKIRNIYYLEMHPEEVLTMLDEISFEDYETYLIWSASENQ